VGWDQSVLDMIVSSGVIKLLHYVVYRSSHCYFHFSSFCICPGGDLRIRHVSGPIPVSPVPVLAGEVAHRYRL
jgi:hypothetical protein